MGQMGAGVWVVLTVACLCAVQLEGPFLDGCTAAASSHCSGEEQMLCALGAVSFIALLSPPGQPPPPARRLPPFQPHLLW